MTSPAEALTAPPRCRWLQDTPRPPGVPPWLVCVRDQCACRYEYKRKWCASLSDAQLAAEIERLAGRGPRCSVEATSLQAYQDEMRERLAGTNEGDPHEQ